VVGDLEFGRPLPGVGWNPVLVPTVNEATAPRGWLPFGFVKRRARIRSVGSSPSLALRVGGSPHTANAYPHPTCHSRGRRRLRPPHVRVRQLLGTGQEPRGSDFFSLSFHSFVRFGAPRTDPDVRGRVPSVGVASPPVSTLTVHHHAHAPPRSWGVSDCPCPTRTTGGLGLSRRIREQKEESQASRGGSGSAVHLPMMMHEGDGVACQRPTPSSRDRQVRS
jgi:hypothetical protein